jgi:hypothetical protein
MGALRTQEVTISQPPKIRFTESYSVQLFFKENENFYVHQIEEEAGGRLQVSETPLEGVEPEVKITINASIDDVLSGRGDVFIDAAQIQVRKNPHCDKDKAMVLLNSLASSF